jgi:hypothetical protein
MKSEQIKEITNRAAEQLVATLQAGRSEALTAYLKAIGRFHRYSAQTQRSADRFAETEMRAMLCASKRFVRLRTSSVATSPHLHWPLSDAVQRFATRIVEHEHGVPAI